VLSGDDACSDGIRAEHGWHSRSGVTRWTRLGWPFGPSSSGPRDGLTFVPLSKEEPCSFTFVDATP
jgi:hypothetical protein